MDQELKQRLIGAAVIIALAVIFVPMLFDGEVEQKNNQNISINIPDVDENSLEVKKFDIDTPVVGTNNMPAGDVELVVNDQKPQLIDKNDSNPIQMDPAENLVPETQTQPAVAETKPEEIKTKPPLEIPADKPVEVVSKPVSQPVNKPVEIKKPDLSSPLNQVYRVKLGSFSQQGNAEKVKSSLLQKNIKAIVEYNPGLKLYRVWSQDLYQDESKANAYVSAVNQQNLNIGTPKVITLSADEVSQMASQGQMGWVVQLGSFSDKKNAIELRNKVKAAGFAGFVDMIFNNKGVQLYRLRIGPLMEKQDAERTQADIKTRLKLDGLIKTHELGQIVD